jgi:hypothetical protein
MPKQRRKREKEEGEGRGRRKTEEAGNVGSFAGSQGGFQNCAKVVGNGQSAKREEEEGGRGREEGKREVP